MKATYIMTIAAAGLLALTSCSDFLTIEPLDDIVEKKFWNEENDVNNVVMGCYSSLQSSDCISRMMCWGEFRSDNIQAGTNADNDEALSNVLKENINAANTFTDWSSIYYVINTCNTVNYYAPKVHEKDPNYTESELRATIAEMSALRDLCYFYLIRAFRDVPYTTTPYLDDTQKMDQPATPFYTVLDSLIQDLEQVQGDAVRKYPEKNDGYQHGRITQDAIHAMLCEMYLWKQDYASAVRYADLVIGAKTADYQQQLDKKGNISENDQMQNGYPLISDKQSTGNYYGNSFNEIFAEGDSRESILELIYGNNNTDLSNGAVSSYYGNATTFPGLVKPAEFLSDDMTADAPEVFLTKYDTRYYTAIEAASSSSYGIGKYALSGNTSIQPQTSATSKALATYGEHYAASYCHANWILYRLTDIMLLKAEALVQMVDDNDSTTAGAAMKDSLLTAAYDIVNTVNLRSNCSTQKTDIDYAAYASKNLMAGLVMDERHRELLFEGKRWFDLVRRSLRDGNTAYLISQVSKKASAGGSSASNKLQRMEAIFWPYNKEELQVNQSLVQNPAFGNGDTNSYETTK